MRRKPILCLSTVQLEINKFCNAKDFFWLKVGGQSKRPIRDGKESAGGKIGGKFKIIREGFFYLVSVYHAV